MSSKYIFDFDRTLFDTDAFFSDLLDVLESEYHIPPAKIRKEEHEFRDDDGNTYDFFRHMEGYTKDTPMEIIDKVRPKLKGGYLYSDARQVLGSQTISRQSQILTIGESKFQHFKIALANLHNFPHAIIREPKLTYMAKNWVRDYSNALFLVDDKAMTFEYETPGNLCLYQVIRSDSQPRSDKPGVTIIDSLEQLEF
jgi:FMN phosphatase YigB (HAD superfamily)